MHRIPLLEASVSGRQLKPHCQPCHTRGQNIELYRIEDGSTNRSMSNRGAGLEGVVATSSSICFIDGEAGVLSYNGFNIHTLAENATFEEVIYLLWEGKLPDSAELNSLKSELVSQRELPQEVTAFLKTVTKGTPMDVLRTAVSMLGIFDPDASQLSETENRKRAAKLVAQIAT